MHDVTAADRLRADGETYNVLGIRELAPHVAIPHGAACAFAFGNAGIGLFDPATSQRL